MKKRKKTEKKGEDLVKLIDRFGGMSAFEDTSINVILVSKGDIEEEESFRPKYRRLFTALIDMQNLHLKKQRDNG